LASAAPWPLGSLFGSFHHAERAPRVISSLMAESPTRSCKNIRTIKPKAIDFCGPSASTGPPKMDNEMQGSYSGLNSQLNE
jgi:hypothetical protein